MSYHSEIGLVRPCQIEENKNLFTENDLSRFFEGREVGDAQIMLHPKAAERVLMDERRRKTAAKALCQTCPFIDECREVGLRDPYASGIWGGLDEKDRDVVRADRLRAQQAADLEESCPLAPVYSIETGQIVNL